MQSNRRTVRVRVDPVTRACLAAITVLLAVLVVQLWAQALPPAPRAEAAEPFLDTSAQRGQIVKTLEKTNAKLDTLIGLFREGKAQVRLVRGDDGEEPPVHAPTPKKKK
jgi:hypothetical protein